MDIVYYLHLFLILATIIFEEGDSVGCEGKKRKSTVKMKCSKREKIRILEEKKCQYELTLSSLDYCSPSATIFDENFSYVRFLSIFQFFFYLINFFL